MNNQPAQWTINLRNQLAHMNTQLAQSMFRVFQEETGALPPMSDAHLTEHARGQYRKHTNHSAIIAPL